MTEAVGYQTTKMDYGFSSDTFLNRNQLLQEALLYSLSDEEREELELDKQKASKSKTIYDAMSNPLQNFGSGTFDLTYMGLGVTPKRNISWQITKLDAIMRSVPYFDKASSWKATRALVNGIDINSKDKKTEDLTMAQHDIAELFSPLHSIVKWGDYYGGAGGLIVCDDTQNEEDYKKPLVISQMRKGSFKGIKPLSRLYQIQPNLSGKLVTQVGEEYGIYSAEEIGQPMYFKINLSGDTEAQSKYFDVHRSRLLLYSSIELTWVEKRIEMYFGPSLLERAYSDFARYESLLAQVNKLAQRSSIPVLNVQNLPQASLNGQRFAEFLVNRIKGINLGVSSGNMVVLGDTEKESFTYQNADFQQIPELLKHYRQNLSATLNAPTREMFNSEEVEDEKIHLTSVREIQERNIRTWFRKLIPIVYKNRYNKNLKDFDFKFKSLEMSTELEKAKKLGEVVKMLSTLYVDNVIDNESYQYMLIASQDNISDIFNEITELYRDYVKQQGLDGEPMNKMANDIKLATALNHANGLESDGSNLSHKVESAQEGSKQGGDPKKTKKPTPKVPIVRKSD